MNVRLQGKGLVDPELRKEVRTLVVYDQYNQPITVIAEHGENIIVTTAKDPNFQTILESLGIGLNAKVRVLNG